jgi:predicted RNase H-like HicB family nuclease
MKTEDRYLKFVRWSDEDHLYVGYCPDLFPWGGVCHANSEEETYGKLCELVREEIEDLKRESKPLPPPSTRPMREVESLA